MLSVIKVQNATSIKYSFFFFSGRPHVYFKVIVLTLEHELESSEGLVTTQTNGPNSRVSDPVGLALEPNDLYL